MLKLVRNYDLYFNMMVDVKILFIINFCYFVEKIVDYYGQLFGDFIVKWFSDGEM